MTDYNFAYLDEQTQRMIYRAILKGLEVPGCQAPSAHRGMPLPCGRTADDAQVLVPENRMDMIEPLKTLVRSTPSRNCKNYVPYQTVHSAVHEKSERTSFPWSNKTRPSKKESHRHQHSKAEEKTIPVIHNYGNNDLSDFCKVQCSCPGFFEFKNYTFTSYVVMK